MSTDSQVLTATDASPSDNPTLVVENNSVTKSVKSVKKSTRTPGKKGKTSDRVSKRHQKKQVVGLDNIKNTRLKRLAHRSGCKVVSSSAYVPLKNELEVFLKQVLRNAVEFTANAKRKTVNGRDVDSAVKTLDLYA